MSVHYKILTEKLRIAVSGKSGCGNTTVSGMLAKKLNIDCINYTFKNLGNELGLSVKEIIERSKTDFSYDKMVDEKQIELAMKDSCVLASRLAVWLLKVANFKVYLYASSRVRAERVHKREGGNLEEIKRFTEKRDEEDTKRYKSLYSIDNDDYRIVDLVIDTNLKEPDQIVHTILDELTKKNLVTCIIED